MSLAMAAAVLAISCQKEPADNNEKDNVINGVYNDRFAVRYEGKACAFGNYDDEYSRAVGCRLMDVTNGVSDDVQTFVVYPSGMSEAVSSSEKVDGLYRHFAHGGSIVLVEPTAEDIDLFAAALDKCYDEALLQSAGCSVSDNLENLKTGSIFVSSLIDKSVGAGKPVGDLVAFRLGSSYYVPDLSASGTVPDYLYGISADLFVYWLNNVDKRLDETSTKVSGAESDIKSLEDAQKVTFQSVCRDPLLGKSMLTELELFVYSAYSFDSDTDYYLVRNCVNTYASRFDGVPNRADAWGQMKGLVQVDDTKDVWMKDPKYFGPYMRWSTVKMGIGLGNETQAKEEMKYYDALPQTTSGSHSISSGFSWTLGGNIGLSSSGFSGGASGSISHSESWSTSQPDLGITCNRVDNNTVSWKTEGVSPITIPGGIFGTTTHSTVGNFQVNDLAMNLTAIYTVAHPSKNRAYTLNITNGTSAGILFGSSDSNIRTSESSSDFRLVLKPPFRARQDWLLLCSSKEAENFVSKQFPSLWQPQFAVYERSDEEVMKKADAAFDSVEKSVSSVGDVMVKQGLTGTYTFSLRKLGESADYRSFTIENGVLKK